MTNKTPQAWPVMGEATQLYGILPEKEARERERYRQERELLAILQSDPEVARKLVRAAQSGVKSAAGSAPKRARATQTAELQKIIADVQRGGVKSGTRLYAKVQAIAQARTPPIACSASTIKAAMRRSK